MTSEGRTAGGSHDEGRLALVVRRDGEGDVRLLEIERMSSDAGEIARATQAAEAGELLVVNGLSVPVFDLRGTAWESAEEHGCLLIGRRGGVSVALLVG